MTNGTRGWRTLAVFLGTLAGVVVAVNLVADAYLARFPVNRGVNRLWQKWQMVERVREPSDWVLLGDSSCTQGLRPDIFRRETGETAINLCTTADSTLVNDAWLLERYLQRMPPPKGVVLFHVFHGWRRPVGPFVKMFHQIPLTGDFWRTMHPALSLDTLTELHLRASALTTLYDRNASVAQVARIAASGHLGREVRRASAIEELDTVIAHGGWVGENTPRPDKVRRDIAEHIALFEPRTFSLDDDNRRALEAIVELSRRHGFALYASHSSIARELYAAPAIRRYMNQVVAEVSPMVRRAPRGAFILTDPPQYEPDEMDNVDHVVGERGSTDLTRRLVAALVTHRRQSAIAAIPEGANR